MKEQIYHSTTQDLPTDEHGQILVTPELLQLFKKSSGVAVVCNEPSGEGKNNRLTFTEQATRTTNSTLNIKRQYEQKTTHSNNGIYCTSSKRPTCRSYVELKQTGHGDGALTAILKKGDLLRFEFYADAGLNNQIEELQQNISVDKLFVDIFRGKNGHFRILLDTQTIIRNEVSMITKF